MKAKIVYILVTTLLIATAFPAVGTINIVKDSMISSIQYNGIEWEKTYGGDEADKFWEVQETDDGGYIACGTTEIDNNICPWILKVDPEGNEEWNWSIAEFYYNDKYFDINYCWCDDVIQITDGGYIACFMLDFEYNQMDYTLGGLVKLDSIGVEEWMKIYGDEFEWTILPETIMEVDDGIIGVGSYCPAVQVDPVDRAVCLFKTNNIGELQWHQEYDYGPIYDWARNLYPTNDGGYFIVGDVGIIANVEQHALIIKTDNQGVKLWDKTFSDGDSFKGILPTTDGIMLSGTTETQGAGNFDVWIVKLDTDGNMIWNKTFGKKSLDYCFDFDKTDDGCFLIPAYIGAGFSADSWIIKIDSNGNVLWKEIYGGSGAQYLIGICSTDDGGCIASGILGAWDGSNSDALLVKYSAFENQRPNTPDKPSGDSEGEPGKEYTFSTSCTDPDGDDLLFMWDWGDGNFSEWLDTTSASYNWSERGNYFVKVMVKDEHGGESDWSEAHEISIPRARFTNRATFNLRPNYLAIFPILKLLLQRLGI